MTSHPLIAAAITPDPAPGAPGIAPTWASSAKDIVGTALGPSRLWFTLGYGIVNEVFWPHVDAPQVRDLGFIVADGKGFWSEIKRLRAYELQTPEPGIPVVSIVHRHDRFTLRLRICPDPDRDVLLVDARLEGEGLRLYALLAPHVGGDGVENVAAAVRHGRWTALCAQRGTQATALLAVDADGNDAWSRTSCGYVGTSDGWQDFHAHGTMVRSYGYAGPGNVALMGELPSSATLALGFGKTYTAAATLAASALSIPFDRTAHRCAAAWRAWHRAMDRRLIDPHLDEDLRAGAAISAMVLKTHEDKVFHGATVASLSTPWGQSRDDAGGYHLVWPRDLTETATGLLSIGAVADARDVLRYVMATQRPAGCWAQNQWLDGTPYWQGLQLDETAFPVVLAAMLADRDALDGIDVSTMVRAAATFIARTGPVTEQDRWEEDAGISPFTLAICISALVCAAEFLDGPPRAYALELADCWNERIEQWTFATDTALARRLGIAGHFVRIAPPAVLEGREALRAPIRIANRPPGDDSAPACDVVGLEFLQLVRMSLRRPDLPWIRDSVVAADAVLRVETPSGAVWKRYPGDGYGEHDDGSPYDGTGCGRPWPLLAGERGWYAGACGEDLRPYLRTMLRCASAGGMIPEQVWDAQPIPRYDLYPGRPTGSAMPLVWAHAEFLKLCASLCHHRSADCPSAVWKRYTGHPVRTSLHPWRLNAQDGRMPHGRILRIETPEPAVVHASTDGWTTTHDVPTRETGLGMHVADLPTQGLRPGDAIVFTLYWIEHERWEGRDFRVAVVAEDLFTP